MIYENPDIESSFKENDLGQTLYDLVLDIKPKKIIEFGALNGYSTVAMAMALQKLGRGVIQSHDLWDTYEFKNATKRETIFNVKAYGVEEYVDDRATTEWLKECIDEIQKEGAEYSIKAIHVYKSIVIIEK